MIGSPGWARTSDFLINSQALYQLSYRGIVCSITYLSRGHGGLTTKCYRNATTEVSKASARLVSCGVTNYAGPLDLSPSLPGLG